MSQGKRRSHPDSANNSHGYNTDSRYHNVSNQHSINTRKKRIAPERTEMILHTLRKMPSDFPKDREGNISKSSNSITRKHITKRNAAQNRHIPSAVSGTRWDLSGPAIAASSSNIAPQHSQHFHDTQHQVNSNTATSGGGTTTSKLADVKENPIGGQLQRSKWASPPPAEETETRMKTATKLPAILSHAKILRATSQSHGRVVAVSRSNPSETSNNTPSHKENTNSQSSLKIKLEKEKEQTGSSRSADDPVIKERYVRLRRDGKTKFTLYTLFIQDHTRMLRTRRDDGTIDIDDPISDETIAKIESDAPTEVVYRSTSSSPVWRFIFNLPQEARCFVQSLLPKISPECVYMSEREEQQLQHTFQQISENSLVHKLPDKQVSTGKLLLSRTFD